MNAALRLPSFVGHDGDASRVLAAAHVAVVGAGSIGLALLQHLVRAGICMLTIVDRGFLKAESVLTHPIPPEAVGRPKAVHAGEVARAIAPEARVMVHQASFEDLPVDTLLGCDAVVLATDNLAVEIEVSQRCLNLGLPLLQGSVQGNLLVAQLRTFTGGQDGNGPCTACLFSASEWQQVSREARFTCDGSTAERGRSLAPTRSTASLCSLAAELAVHRVLRHLLGLGAPLADQILDYHGYTDSLTTSVLRRNPDCPVEHARWQVLARQDVDTVGDALAASGISAATVAVDRASFVTEAACACGSWQVVGRFVNDGEDPGTCHRCGSVLVLSPFHAHPEVAADTPGLAGVKIPKDHAVLVRARTSEVVMFPRRQP